MKYSIKLAYYEMMYLKIMFMEEATRLKGKRDELARLKPIALKFGVKWDNKHFYVKPLKEKEKV
jgi:hypothetical protein